METPQSLIAAVRYLSDLKICSEYMRQIKWPNGEMCCHHCGGVRTVFCGARPCPRPPSRRLTCSRPE